jgi:hypothetical protein
LPSKAHAIEILPVHAENSPVMVFPKKKNYSRYSLARCQTFSSQVPYVSDLVENIVNIVNVNHLENC